jgi:L-seryl-tRNA(Ser) seleniumtransferase
VQKLMTSAPAQALAREFTREETVNALRARLARVRASLGNGGALPDFSGEAFFNEVRAEILGRRARSLRRVINATGIVVHTNLGRAPLAPEAVEAIAEIASVYSNLEFDLDAGARGSRYRHVAALLEELTGAEAALVVNNGAAAVLAALTALARGAEVLVSRGELIEIGGSFRIPEVIAQSGARLTEVGATNKTRIADFERAIGPDTRLILSTHPSNFRMIGFTARPSLAELAALARSRGLLLVEDLGSGAMVDLGGHLPSAEPIARDSLAAGVDVVAFSGDKLLGGPQAGILLGRRASIEAIASHPLLRALRIDKLSLAALEATLLLYRAGESARERIPVLRMLSEPAEAVRRRANRLARGLRGFAGLTVRREDAVTYTGGGALPMVELPTSIVRVERAGMNADRLSAVLRRADPPVIARIDAGTVVLDARTLSSQDVREIVAIFRGLDA